MSKAPMAILLTCLALLNSGGAIATSVDELLQSDRLRVRTWLQPAEDIVAGQQVELQIEVATDKWFAGGTRIAHFEIVDAIALQREQFALNSTRQKDGKTWTVQQWTLVVYPQRAGAFEVPSIKLDLAIAGDELETISGTMLTQPFAFTASTPDAMRDQQQWIATTHFEVSETYSKPLDTLRPGDALQRNIRMSAENLPAMMLPQPEFPEIAGVATYRKSPRLDDRQNRGVYRAERNQEVTYVFENPGEFELPAQTFLWWNLESGSAEAITLPAQTLNVAGPPVSGREAGDAASGSAEWTFDWQVLLYPASVFFLLTLAGLWLLRKLRLRHRADTHARAGEPDAAELLKQARLAAGQGQSEQALASLYRWLDRHAPEAQGSIRRQIEILHSAELESAYQQAMRSVYAAGGEQAAGISGFIDRLIDAVRRRGKKLFGIHKPVRLKLN